MIPDHIAKKIYSIYVLYTPKKISIVPKCQYSTWILHKKIYIPYLGLNSVSSKCFQSKDWKVLLFKQIELIKKSLEHDHSLWLSTCLYWQQWFKGSQLLFTVTVVFLHRIKYTMSYNHFEWFLDHETSMCTINNCFLQPNFPISILK